jgi:hypothetical protein
VTTGAYLDMCNKCYYTIQDDIISEERYDLYDGDEEQTTEEKDSENYD